MTEETPKLERVLVGRQRELNTLWSQFEKATTGRLHVTLVAGEPGIGKTRLLHEVAGRAEQGGGLVLRSVSIYPDLTGKTSFRGSGRPRNRRRFPRGPVYGDPQR